MPSKQQLNQILEGGFDSVTETGVRAFTVESLAKRLAMSKKTIYKFFPTKEKLIFSIMQFAFNQINSAFNKIMIDEYNPAIQFIKIMETIAKFAGRSPVDKISELKSRYPDIWREIESFRLSHQDRFLKNDLPIRETIRGFVQIVARGIFTNKGMKAIKEHYEQN